MAPRNAADQDVASDETADDASAPSESEQDKTLILNSAAQRTLAITELLEAILANLHSTDIACCEAVSIDWRDLIRLSPALQQICFFTPQTPNLMITATEEGFLTGKFYYCLKNDVVGTRLYSAGNIQDVERYANDKTRARMHWNPIIQPNAKDEFSADLVPLFDAQNMETWRWKDSLVCDPPAVMVVLCNQNHWTRLVFNEKGVTFADVYRETIVQGGYRYREKQFKLLLEEKHVKWLGQSGR